MPDLTVTNWFGDVVSHPQVVVEAHSEDDIFAILKDPAKYPPPIRAVGSAHSTTPCAAADGGTVIQMGSMNRILNYTADTVTVEAGALYIDIAKELEQKQLQHYVNTEIGNLSAGSAACTGTKDASMPGEYGQVGSYVAKIKMALPPGDFLEVDESQPDLLQLVRSSYGLFGIVTEVTFRVRPIVPLAVHHETYSLQDFSQKLPELKAGGESLMFYIFPFQDLITVEFRHYNAGAPGGPNRVVWPLRNYLWGSAGPAFCYHVTAEIADSAIRYGVIDGFCELWRFKLTHLIQSDYTIAADQMIRYPHVADNRRYTFSFYAFPEDTYLNVLSAYFQFCKDYYKQKGYRSNMLTVGYRVLQDKNSLLSYSYDGNVMTIDPVSTANTGWNEFLDAYNDFCAGHSGSPLLNQTDRLTRAQAQKAFGDRLKRLGTVRKTYDPQGRLLNAYFKDLLAE